MRQKHTPEPKWNDETQKWENLPSTAKKKEFHVRKPTNLYTPEPWVLEDGIIKGANGNILTEHMITNAERMVACVNAMEGIEDPQKLRETYEVCKELEMDAYHKVKAENDELKHAFKELFEYVHCQRDRLDKEGWASEEEDELIKKYNHLIQKP